MQKIRAGFATLAFGGVAALAFIPIGATAPAGAQTGCNPNYSPCVPNAADVDCASGSGNGPVYIDYPVTVIGQDVYGLDGTPANGIGCDNETGQPPGTTEPPPTTSEPTPPPTTTIKLGPPPTTSKPAPPSAPRPVVAAPRFTG